MSLTEWFRSNEGCFVLLCWWHQTAQGTAAAPATFCKARQEVRAALHGWAFHMDHSFWTSPRALLSPTTPQRASEEHPELWKHQKHQFINTCLQRSDRPLKTKMALLSYYSNKVLSMIFEVMSQPPLLCHCWSVSHLMCCQLIRVCATDLPCKLVKPLADFVTDLRAQAI